MEPGTTPGNPGARSLGPCPALLLHRLQEQRSRGLSGSTSGPGLGPIEDSATVESPHFLGPCSQTMIKRGQGNSSWSETSEKVLGKC